MKAEFDERLFEHYPTCLLPAKEQDIPDRGDHTAEHNDHTQDNLEGSIRFHPIRERVQSGQASRPKTAAIARYIEADGPPGFAEPAASARDCRIHWIHDLGL